MSSNSSEITAQYALKKLIVGNRRFVSGQSQHPRQNLERRSEIVANQTPFAVILTCSDSRVAPEILFDQGLGDLFVIRTAGNILNDDVLESIEYAVEVLGVPLVIVLGHQNCDVITSAVENEHEPPVHFSGIQERLEPVLEKARQKDGDLLENAIDANINHVVNQLRNSEPLLLPLLKDGRVKIGGARYDLDTSMVVWL